MLKSYQKKNRFQVKECDQGVHHVSLKPKKDTGSGVVGESGSGETGPGKLVHGVEQPGCGRLLFRAHNIHIAPQNAKKQLCKQVARLPIYVPACMHQEEGVA